MRYVLGLDVSTTATKALLVNERGAVVATAAATYTYSTPAPLWSEQDPALWWQAAISSIRAVLASAKAAPEQVAAVGLSGQMHGLVLLDAADNVLRPAILWNDQRTQAQCERLIAQVPELIQLTGNTALTGFTAPKLLWVKQHEPALYARIAHILLPKDYVRLQLTGTYAIDKADGAGTLLFDLARRDWASALPELLGFDPAWLPPSFEGPAITGQISAAAAAATGLAAGTPVVAGGGDQAANAVGTGAIDPGVLALSLGTSGVIFASTAAPIIEPAGRLHAFCHALPERWHLMGVILSAAGSLRWYRDTLAPSQDFASLLEPAAAVAPGAEGLLFLPYLTGERTPHPDPLARGAFVGLTVRHQQAHLTRAVLEGVAFGLRDSLELMRAAGLRAVTQIRASGGGMRSALWRQILADVLDAELVQVNTSEGAAYGAALLAAVGCGWFPDVASAVSACVQVTERTQPSAQRDSYTAAYAIYRELYPALRDSFARLATLAH